MRSVFAGLVAALAAAAVTSVAAQSDMPLSPQLQHMLTGDAAAAAAAASDPRYTYPTALTQGIIPKGVHSHNDYWRPLPLLSALAAGAISVEADVWLVNGTLHVGHERSALTAARTLLSLYVEPLRQILRQQNPNSSFVDASAAPNGVFDTARSQTLYLFVDVKTDGAATWPAVVAALAPLRAAGYLTTYNGSVVTTGPVTVVGTGNTPLGLVQGVAPRDYFWDGPLATLAASNLTSSVSPIASVSFKNVFGNVWGVTLSRTQQATLAAQVAEAHGRGMLARYWDQPGWPVRTRNAVWRELSEAGVDLLNVDDLGVVDF